MGTAERHRVPANVGEEEMKEKTRDIVALVVLVFGIWSAVPAMVIAGITGYEQRGAIGWAEIAKLFGGVYIGCVGVVASVVLLLTLVVWCARCISGPDDGCF